MMTTIGYARVSTDGQSLDAQRVALSDRVVLSGAQRMSVIGEILTKFFAIGIAGAGAFVATTYILNNNWLY